MKITSISVEGVGKFDCKREVKGLAEGVNILSAGNEAGKSTLFRAVRTCLFDRHNSKSGDIKLLASEGKQLPVTVTMGFEHASETYSISKSFLRSPSAKLLRGGVEIARNNEADELLWEILGIRPGARSVDQAAFGLLWVGQGQSFLAPEPSEGATSALNSVIQTEVGGLVGGERARLVLKSLEDDLGKIVTEASGRPKAGGPLHDAILRRNTLNEELEANVARLDTLDQQIGALAVKRKTRGNLADPVALKQVECDLEAAQKRLKEVNEADLALRHAESAVQRCKAILDHHERVDEDLRTRAGRIDGDRDKETQILAELDPLEQKEFEARRLADEVRAEIGKLTEKAGEDDQEERRLIHLASVIDRAAKRDVLVSLKDDLEGLTDRMARNSASLAENLATAEISKQVSELERGIAGLAARLEAAAPSVAVDLGADRSKPVTVSGEPIDKNRVLSAVEPVAIKVGDIATITISPPKGAGAADHGRLQEAQNKLGKLLRSSGVETISEFRAARAKREEFESEARVLAIEFKALGVKEETPAAAIERLTTDIAAIDLLVKEALEKCGVSCLPSADEVSERRDELRLAREAARSNRQTLDGKLDAQVAILSELGTKRGQFVGSLSEIRSRLEADLLILPDVDRPERLRKAEGDVTSARDEFRIKAAAYEEQRLQTPEPEEVDRCKNHVTRLASALERQRQGVGELDREIANLEGQIQSAGGDGLGEKVEELRQAFDLASREVERIEDRVKTLQLLKSTIDDCYKEQRDRLQAPLRRHIKPYLNDVFPMAEIELGDGFEIEGIKRAKAGSEKFERLSAGTQEQIAVLVRLAMGAMLCERGEPVPIILDDALVFSDDDRIEQMFDALIRAGKIQQVIVLTCRSRAFARLGGHGLSIADSVAN